MPPYRPSPTRYDNITYRRCGRAACCCRRSPWDCGTTSAGWTRSTTRAIVRRAFDLGITHFDLANNYGPPPGSAEETFGRDPAR